VQVVYERRNIIKRIKFHIATGKQVVAGKQTFITPPEAELFILDRDAEIVFDKNTL